MPGQRVARNSGGRLKKAPKRLRLLTSHLKKKGVSNRLRGMLLGSPIGGSIKGTRGKGTAQGRASRTKLYHEMSTVRGATAGKEKRHYKQY